MRRWSKSFSNGLTVSSYSCDSPADIMVVSAMNAGIVADMAVVMMIIILLLVFIFVVVFGCFFIYLFVCCILLLFLVLLCLLVSLF